MSNTKKHDAVASEGARRATEDATASSAPAGAGRWSSRRKVSIVLELLRGADLESTSRHYRVTAATLTDWRDRCLEVETMSRTVSPSSHQQYGVARVTSVWNLARSSFYAARQRVLQPREPK